MVADVVKEEKARRRASPFIQVSSLRPCLPLLAGLSCPREARAARLTLRQNSVPSWLPHWPT